MRNFKDYTGGGQNANGGNVGNVGQNANGQGTAEDLARKVAAAWNGKSDATILREIMREAEKGKRAGTLTNREIDEFYASFSPMLAPFQRKKLKEILDKLKKL